MFFSLSFVYEPRPCLGLLFTKLRQRLATTLLAYPGFHRFPFQFVQVLSQEALHIPSEIDFNSNREPHVNLYEDIMAIIWGDTGIFDPYCPRLSFLVYIVSCVEKNTVTFCTGAVEETRRVFKASSLSSHVWLTTDKPHAYK